MQRCEWMRMGLLATLVSLPTAGAASAQVVCQARIGDYVYEDINGNGLQDGPDLGIDGVTLSLSDELGNPIATTVSQDGVYSFEGLCEQTYIVDVDDSTLPPGLMPTVGGAGSDPEGDSNTAPVVVTMAGPSAINNSIDFGYTANETDCTGFIGDFTFEDVNGNGVQDAPDGSLGGVRVVLTDADGNSFESVSDPIQGYGFDGLCAGDYTLAVDESTLPPGLVATVSNAGGDDTMDSDGSPVMVTLASDDAFDPDVDFGFMLQISECGMHLAASAIPPVIEKPGPFDWICRGGHLVFYRYNVTNDGPSLKQIAILDDARGWVGYLWRLATGESRTRWSLACIDQTTVSHLTATGTLEESGETCTASDAVTVEVDLGS